MAAEKTEPAADAPVDRLTTLLALAAAHEQEAPKIPASFNAGTPVPTATTIRAHSMYNAAQFLGTHVWVAAAAAAAAQLEGSGANRELFLKRFTTRAWKTQFIADYSHLFNPEENGAHSPIQFDVAILYHPDVRTAALDRLTGGCTDGTWFRLLAIDRGLGPDGPPPGPDVEGYQYLRLTPERLHGLAAIALGAWPTAINLIGFLRDKAVPDPPAFYGRYDLSRHSVHVTFDRFAGSLTVLPRVTAPERTAYRQLGDDDLIGAVSDPPDDELVPPHNRMYDEGQPYKDGYCYLQLLQPADRRKAFDALGDYPTSGELVDWASAASVPYDAEFSGTYNPGSKLVHVQPPNPGLARMRLPPPGVHALPRDALVGGDNPDVAHLNSASVPAAGNVITVRWPFTTDTAVRSGIADIVAGIPSLRPWSSVVFLRAVASIKSAGEGADVSLGLGHSLAIVATASEIAMCVQTAFGAATTQNAGGADIVIEPDGGYFDTQVSAICSSSGRPRPVLYVLIACPNNELVTLDLVFHVCGSALVRGPANILV